MRDRNVVLEEMERQAEVYKACNVILWGAYDREERKPKTPAARETLDDILRGLNGVSRLREAYGELASQIHDMNFRDLCPGLAEAAP